MRKMNIKDFKEGQTVYVLNMHTGRNTEPTIRKNVVDCIGRKYVTVAGGARYESSSDPYSLIENTDFGERTFLCPSMEYAQMYVERYRLRLWLYQAAQWNNRYTLEQLRKVKEILESGESL